MRYDRGPMLHLFRHGSDFVPNLGPIEWLVDGEGKNHNMWW